MLQRLSSSLFAPRDVVKYRDDKWWMTVIVFVVLLILLIIPISATVIQTRGISYDIKKEIRNSFNGNQYIPFTIENGTLKHDTNDQTYIYYEEINPTYSVIMTLNEDIDKDVIKTPITFVFRVDGVYLLQSIFEQQLFTYQKYSSLEGIDFNQATSVKNVDFWDRIFHVAELELSEMKPLINVISISYNAAVEAFSLIMISLIFTVFQYFRLSKFLRFTKIWKLCLYLTTPFVVGKLLALLFNFSLFYYFGFLLTFIYIEILSQTIRQLRRE